MSRHPTLLKMHAHAGAHPHTRECIHVAHAWRPSHAHKCRVMHSRPNTLLATLGVVCTAHYARQRQATPHVPVAEAVAEASQVSCDLSSGTFSQFQ